MVYSLVMKIRDRRVTIVLIAGLMICSRSFAQAPKPLPSSVELGYTPMLTVSGRGEVFATPDRAVIRLGAEAQAKEAAAAQSTVNQTMAKALAEIQKLGIEQRSIRTLGLNLFPVYASPGSARQNEEPRVTGYRAANTIEVTVNDLTLVGKIIDTGMAAGVNRLEGVSFELRDDLPQRSQALQRAIEEAKSKAQAMAPALDAKLGRLREVIEGGVAVEPPQPFFARGMRASFGAAETPVQPGELRVEASVTLRYEIVP